MLEDSEKPVVSFDQLIDEVQARLAGEEPEDQPEVAEEVGPEDSLEEDPAEGDEVADTVVDPDEEETEGEPSEEDDPEEAEASDDDEEAEEVQEAEDAPESDDEVADLRKSVGELQSQLSQALELIKYQQRPAPRPQAPQEPDLPLEAIQAALGFGGNLEGLDEVTKRRALEVAQTYAKRESRYAAKPEARYEGKFREAVLRDVAEALKPVIQDYHDRQAKQSVSALGDMTQQDKDRIAKIYHTLPGANSRDWKIQQATLEAASARYRVEKQEAALAARERKIAAREKQVKANRRSAKKRGRGAPAGVPTPQKPKPKLQPGEDIGDFAERLRLQG